MTTQQQADISLLAASLGAVGISAEDPNRCGSGTDAATASAEPVAETPPALLPELWGSIARAAVEAEGCTLEALQRLSLVCTAWYDALEGLPVVLRFDDVMRPFQRLWLRTTLQPIREIAFCSLDASTHHLLVDPTTLRPSEGTLRRAQNVFCTDAEDGSPIPLDHPGLARFSRLAQLGLLSAHRGSLGGVGQPTTWLPASLQDLRLDHDPQGWTEAPLRAHELPVLRLGSLTQLTRLTFAGHRFLWRRPDPSEYDDQYPDAEQAQLPRSLLVLRVEGPLVDPADATIHAYGASCARAAFHPALEVVASQAIWLRSRRCHRPWSMDMSPAPDRALLPAGFGELRLLTKDFVMWGGVDGRGHPATGAGDKDALARVNAMPTPDPVQQLWEILRLAPPNIRRIQIACDPYQKAPGASQSLTLDQHWLVFRTSDGHSIQREKQVFVEFFDMADHLMDVVEDGGFELHLYLQATALALQRSC